jgi:outer membrane immunogenic protein
MGPALFYGTLGYGFSEWEEGSANPGDLYDVDGVLLGAGVDYLVTDQLFLGAEVLRRSMDSDFPFDADLTTFTFRAGITF